jgi:hypothetical protein
MMPSINIKSLDLPKRHKNFSEYKCANSGLKLHDIVYNQNYQNYIQNKSAEPIGSIKNSYMANDMAFYKKFLHDIQVQGYEFLTVEKTMQRDGFRDGSHAVIRHDVDGDLPAALRCAEVENQLGISSTYYLLHTGPYYGTFANGVFSRNEACAEIYLEIQSLGHEIGLHTDPMWVFQQWKMDGVEALVEELNWLRSLGIRIVGTAPHNSPAVYGGISNSELFKDVYHYKNKVFDKQTPADIIQDKILGIPLRTVDQSKIGLTYEADSIFDLNFVFDWMSIINYDRNQRYIWWDRASDIDNFVKETPIIADFVKIYMDRFGGLSFAMDHAESAATLIPEVPHLLYLSVHPEYYSRRQFYMSWP